MLAPFLTLAGQFVRAVILVLHVRVHVQMMCVAHKDVAVFLELIFVVRDDFGGRIVRLVFQRHHFQPKAKAGNIYVGALVSPESFSFWRAPG